jgi:hypothetical protein
LKYPPFITLPYALERDPPPFEGPEIKYPESLVRYFLDKYTCAGDRVFDPFSGHGTTLFVAEEMHCIPFGFESNRQRFEWVAGQLEHWRNLVHGDSARLLHYGLPKMDFCMTSPPFMPRHHRWNPLFNGDPDKAGYDAYLTQMTYIYEQLSRLLKRNAYAVVQVDNLAGTVFTPLVWDIGKAIGEVMRLESEIIVSWKMAKKDYPHTHCLVFRNTRQRI